MYTCIHYLIFCYLYNYTICIFVFNIPRRTNSVAPYSYDLFSLHRPFDLNGSRQCRLQILNGNDQ